jgi:hypothetical protein
MRDIVRGANPNGLSSVWEERIDRNGEQGVNFQAE